MNKEATVPNKPCDDKWHNSRPFVYGTAVADVAETGVLVTSSFRTSGLLLLLPAVDLKCLITLLTFPPKREYNQPGTTIGASLRQLAYAMHTSEAKARRRLMRLMHFTWDGQPLIHELTKPNGLHYYMLSNWLLAPTLPMLPAQLSEQHGDRADQPNIAPAPSPNARSIQVRRRPVRDIIVAQNRRRYAQPRNIVEQHIALQMGWKRDHEQVHKNEPTQGIANSSEDELKQALRHNGLSRIQADYLLQTFDREDIRRQLEWLPLRHATSPGRYLYAAISGKYGAPRGAPNSPRPTGTPHSTKRNGPAKATDGAA